MRKLISTFTHSWEKMSSFIRRHSLAVPTLFSFFCFMISVLLILSIWFTGNVTSTLENALYENALQSSVKAANQLRLTFSDINNVASHLKQIDEISPHAFQSSAYEAYQTLLRYDYSSFKYSNLAFCYEGIPMLLTVNGTCYAPVLFPEVPETQPLMDAIYAASTVRLASTAEFGAQQDASRLLIIYPMSSQHAAVFFLNDSMLSGMVSAYMGQEDLQVLFGVDGSVLWSNTPIQAETANLLHAHIKEGKGGRKLSLNDTDYIYSASAIAYGSTLVMLGKITTQFDSLTAIIRMQIFICCLILFLGLFLLLFSVRRGYMPIAHLVQELRDMLPEQQDDTPPTDIATLRQAYSQYSILLQESQKNAAFFSSDQLRSLFVLRTISGRYSSAEELYNLCQWLNLDFPYPCFFACLLLFDPAQGEQVHQYMEETPFYTSQEGFISCFYLLPDGHSAVGIINVPTTDSEQLRTFGERLIAQFPAELQTTVGMGQIYEDISSLGKSYLEAHAALDYRLIKGKNTWIAYDEINFDSSESPYPRQLINSYFSALHSWDVQGIREKLQQIADYIHTHNLPLQQVKCVCYDLTSSFLREISSLDNHVTYKLSATYDVFNIAEYDSVSELVQNISHFSENIQQYINKRDEFTCGNLVSQCIEYLRENIDNPQFSLNSCSERFDIAPQTLRRKFKEATGQTLSGYITALRINRAKDLLISSDLDINKICVQCGYLDLSSFIRMFKGEVGVSPGTFRQMNQNTESSR